MKHGEVGSERASRVSERSDMPSYSKRRLHFYLGNDKRQTTKQRLPFSCMHGGLTQTHMRLFFLGRSQSIIMYTKIYIYF